MSLSSPGEQKQTLTQWTVHTKGFGLFTTNYLIHKSPQAHCTPTMAL